MRDEEEEEAGGGTYSRARKRKQTTPNIHACHFELRFRDACLIEPEMDE